MSLTEEKLMALTASWRHRAKSFMQEAAQAGNVRDIYRLAGMASSLNFAARDLCWAADVDPSAAAAVANPEADRARLDADIQLAHDAKGPQST